MEALMGVVVVQKGADAAECVKSYTTELSELYPCMSVFKSGHLSHVRKNST